MPRQAITAISTGLKRPKPRRAGVADERIHRELADAIIDHRIPPGTSLPEDTLAAAFGVSRTVARKALLRLGHEKLVELRPNRGAMVARPSVEEAKAVFEARRVVEAAIIDAAVGRVSAGAIADLRAGLAAEQEAERADDRHRQIRLSGAFHRGLAAQAGNDVLAGFLAELIARSSLILALYHRHAGVLCSHDEHAAVLEAIARRDAERAKALMAEHLGHIEAQLDLGGPVAPIDLHALFAGARLRAQRQTA